MRRNFTKLLLALSLLAPATLVLAAEPLEPIQVGTPQRIEVSPPAFKLAGPRRQLQLVVTGVYADGTVQDLTRAAQFAPSDAAVATVEGSIVKPHKDGNVE